MSSNTSKRRFFERNASPVVASEEDFDAVFGSMTAPGASTAQDIPIERIRPNPFQARVRFNDIEPLADSMRMHGFTSRLRVRRDPAQPQFFQLAYGERRLRAAQAAGIIVIPCDIAEYSDTQMREIGLTENIQRSDLEPLEEARAFRVAIDRGGYSIRSLAAQIGKSKGYVQSRLDILRAPEDVLEMVDQHPETFTAGLLIAQLPSIDVREPLIKRVIAGEIDKETVRAVVRDVAATTALPPSTHGSASRTVDRQPTERASIDDRPVPSSIPEPQAIDETQPTTRWKPATEHPRAARQSERALGRATQTLDLMLTQLHHIVPELQSAERLQLRDVLLERHLPALHQIIRELEE